MIDLLIILAFVAYSISAGFRARKRASAGLEQYFLAGRSLPGWKAGISMAATQYAADTPLLVTGLIATGGLFMLWRLWIYGLAFLMMGFLLGPAWRAAGVLTDAELTEVRYSGGPVVALRGLKAVYYGTVINCTVMAMVLVAATRISQTFLPWHEWLPGGVYEPLRRFVAAVGVPLATGVTGAGQWTATADNLISILLIAGFTFLYSATGGLRSVVDTDLVQFIIMMVATAIYAGVAVAHAGGFGGIWERLEALYGAVAAGRMLSFSPGTGEALLPFLTVIGLQWFYQVNSDGTGYLAQRTMGCRSGQDARYAGFIFTAAQVLVRSLMWLPIGVALLVLYPFEPSTAADPGFTSSRELLFATGIKDLLPPGVRGLMLTGLLAALASTIDTHLSWGASYWANDLYLRILNRGILKREPSPREQVLVARLSNVVVLAIALGIMANLGSIQEAWHLTLLFGAGMGAVLVLRWTWERVNLYSEIGAIAGSLVIAPLLLMTVEQEWLRLALMAAGSTVVTLVFTWLTPWTSPQVLQQFYRRVRPPGLWRRTAQAAGDDPRAPGRRFREGALLVVGTAASIFLLHYGIGRLMLPSPNTPLWMPWLANAAGLALAVIWWRRVFPRRAGTKDPGA